MQQRTASLSVMCVCTTMQCRLFFSQFDSKLKGIKTQAFPKLNQNFSKLKHFLLSKLNFSENMSTLDARKDFLFNEKIFYSVINSKQYEKLKRKSKKWQNSRKFWHQNSRKQPKLKFSENLLAYMARQTAKKKPVLQVFLQNSVGFQPDLGKKALHLWGALQLQN